MKGGKEREDYAEVLTEIAFDLKFGEDKKTIAGSLRAIADELDPPRKKYSYNPEKRRA